MSVALITLDVLQSRSMGHVMTFLQYRLYQILFQVFITDSLESMFSGTFPLGLASIEIIMSSSVFQFGKSRRGTLCKNHEFLQNFMWSR